MTLSRSRRHAPTTALVLAAALAAPLAAAPAGPAQATPASIPAAAASPAAEPYLVGRGIADITGPSAENGMMGYSKTDQIASGIRQRLRARTFVVAEPNGKRVAYVVAEMGMDFRVLDEEVARRLAAAGLAERYTRDNVLITGTHTHSGPGGYSGNIAYNLATRGYQAQLVDALASGIVESIRRADADLKPGSITLGRTSLTNASVNRSKSAFDRNPAADKAPFPGGIDPSSTTLKFFQGGTEVGMLNWFAVHATSLPNTNTLLSPDNKGYAAYHVERELKGVDYLAKSADAYVAAFAAGAEGDLSPNLNLRPGSGPTDDPEQNVRIIGRRQADAALAAPTTTPVDGPIDYRKRYVDLGATTVSGQFTDDGRSHTTCRGAVSAAQAAGSTEDGPALPGFTEGTVDVPTAVANALRRPVPAALKTCQSPKLALFGTGALGITPDVVPFQLVRLGQLTVVGTPGEVSAVGGYRLRRTVAQAIGTSIDDVVVQPYTGDYNSYATTPEEYDAQQYEGGSTLNGRWQLPAYQQELAAMATALTGGQPTPDTARVVNPPFFKLNWQTGVVFDLPVAGHRYGDVLTEPAERVARGATATAVFVTGHPKNDLRRGGTYLEVQRLVDGAWQRVADDGDISTTFRWTRILAARSSATITWTVPDDAPAGTYRIVHRGAAKSALGVAQFTGTSRSFTVQ